jgi:hypothetical protein
MTLLSQSLLLLRRARALLQAVEARELAEVRSAPAGGVQGISLATPVPSAQGSAQAAKPARAAHLRVVSAFQDVGGAVADRDTSIRVSESNAGLRLPAPVAPGAQPFLAGTGARLYSLDAWRREHPPRGRTPHAA